MKIHTIETRTHGRYLVDRPSSDQPLPALVGFHGYAETAETMMNNLRQVADGLAGGRDGWCLVSIQGLHRFYTRRQDVAANWMTRQDRELAIEDNTRYVWSVVRAVEQEYRTARPLVFAGFSQGVAMAYRAAAAGTCDALVVLAGDVPPDVVPRAAQLPAVLIGRGAADEWYTADKAAADLATLRDAGVDAVEFVYDGGHEWDGRFSERAQRFLSALPAFSRA